MLQNGRSKMQKRMAQMVTVAAISLGYMAGLIGPSAVFAYDDFDKECHLPYSGGTSLLYPYYANDQFYPPGATYQPVFDAARIDWNNSPTPILFTYVFPQVNWTFGAKFFGANNSAGITYYSCGGSGGVMNSANAWENRTYMDSATVFTRQAVASHELGHFIGLGHSYYQAIMGVNDGTFNGTLMDDWCGINHIYASTTYPPQCGY